MTDWTVDVFSKRDCPHCIAAQTYLADQNIPFNIIKLDDTAERHAFYDAEGLIGTERTVPQVFVTVDGVRERIGGAHELRISGIESLLRLGKAA